MFNFIFRRLKKPSLLEAAKIAIEKGDMKALASTASDLLNHLGRQSNLAESLIEIADILAKNGKYDTQALDIYADIARSSYCGALEERALKSYINLIERQPDISLRIELYYGSATHYDLQGTLRSLSFQYMLKNTKLLTNNESRAEALIDFISCAQEEIDLRAEAVEALRHCANQLHDIPKRIQARSIVAKYLPKNSGHEEQVIKDFVKDVETCQPAQQAELFSRSANSSVSGSLCETETVAGVARSIKAISDQDNRLSTACSVARIAKNEALKTSTIKMYLDEVIAVPNKKKRENILFNAARDPVSDDLAYHVAIYLMNDAKNSTDVNYRVRVHNRLLACYVLSSATEQKVASALISDVDRFENPIAKAQTYLEAIRSSLLYRGSGFHEIQQQIMTCFMTSIDQIPNRADRLDILLQAGQSADRYANFLGTEFDELIADKYASEVEGFPLISERFNPLLEVWKNSEKQSSISLRKKSLNSYIDQLNQMPFLQDQLNACRRSLKKLASASMFVQGITIHMLDQVDKEASASLREEALCFAVSTLHSTEDAFGKARKKLEKLQKNKPRQPNGKGNKAFMGSSKHQQLG